MFITYYEKNMRKLKVHESCNLLNLYSFLCRQLLLMNQNKSNPHEPEIILVYYNYKGVGQVIRFLLSYLQINYADIFIDQYQTQKHSLSQKVRKTLEAHPVNIPDLPAIIHDGEVIYELNRIMIYICRAFDREDLLGNTIQNKAKVCEIMEIYAKMMPQSIRFIIGYFNQVVAKKMEGVQLLAYIEQKFSQLLDESGYIREVTTYLLKQDSPKFVFDQITIVDFYYIQGVRHALGVFGAIDEQTASSRWKQIAKKYRIMKEQKGESVRNVDILRVLKKYYIFFHSQPFYAKNIKHFEGFKLLANQAFNEAARKLWAIQENLQLQ